MPMTATRRLARAVACAAASTLVALAGHVLAGGAAPTAEALVVALALSVAVCGWLAGRELSLWRLSVGVLASQWLFHTLFAIGTGGVAVTASDPSAHHSALVVDAAGHAGHGTHAMTLGHLVAALVTIAALRRAESAWVRLRDGVRSIVASWHAPLARGPLAIAPSRALIAPRPSAAHHLAVARAPATRRGPPTLAR